MKTKSESKLIAFLAAVVLFSSNPLWAQAPAAFTQPAGPIGPTNVMLNGMALAKVLATTVWFDWGPDGTYGNSTTPTGVGAGSQVVRLSAGLGGLAAGAVYHYRLVASNSLGVAYGADQLFTTGTRMATWSDPTRILYPTPPAGLDDLVGIASGHGHTLAIRSDGSVVAWGDGIPLFYPNNGQTNVPAGLSNVVAVAGGWVHSLALKQDGTVTAWGKYAPSGRLAYVPAGVSNVIAIAGGDSHDVALRADGIVLAWGDNSSGQTNVPRGLTNVVAISAGSTHSLALKADGTVVAWGVDTFNPTPPAGLSNVVAISTETWYNLALRADGTIAAWGADSAGQTSVPPGLSNMVAIAAGFEGSLALRSDGTLIAWGGPGAVTNLPPGLNNVVAISSGDYHAAVLSPVNVPPTAFSTWVSGPTNFDLSFAFRGWDPNGDALTFRILGPPTNGVLYQYAAGSRGDPITASNTPVSDVLGRVVYAPQPNSYGAPYDAILYLCNDGQADSAPGLLTIRILPPPLIQAAGFLESTNAGFALTFAGLSNAIYSVRATGDFTNWSYLGRASQPAPGQFYFLDSGATNNSLRFYRISSP